MFTKLLSTAIVTGILFSVAGPIAAQAATTPKTKADCAKVKTMKWDAKAGKCMKK